LRDPLDPTHSLYDAEIAEEDLWFLPGDPEDAAPTDPPWTIADHTPVFEVRDWLKAERGLGVELARAAAGFAALDERLRRADPGLRHRLALREISDLSWVTGSHIPVERLSLYEVLRLSSAGEDVRDLQSASWALRRLLAKRGPLDWPDTGVEGFLGRSRVEDMGFVDHALRPTGDALLGLVEEWQLVLDAVSGAHPISRAAIGFFAWRAFETSGPGEIFEGAIAAAKLGAEEGRGGLPFLPVAGGQARLYRLSDAPEVKLRKWYQAVEQACLRALMELDRLEDWQDRASQVIAGLSGKTPPKLIEALSASPVLSAEMAADLTGVSKAASLRNLTEFERRGLVREITGQGRFRFWTARW
jgi:hypothetical protein